MASGMDSASWDRRYDGSELVWTAEPNRFLVAETETLAPGRAIDLACGEGRNAVWLAERGWQAVGVDFSEVGLRKARELADSRGVNVEWVAADLLDYHPDPQAFDLVLVFYLQVPAAERRRDLPRGRRRRRPGRHVSGRRARQQQPPSTDTAARRIPPCSTPRDDVVSDIDGRGLHIERAERWNAPYKRRTASASRSTRLSGPAASSGRR